MKSLGQKISFTSPLAFLGRTVVAWVDELGSLAVFFARGFILIFRRKQFSMIVQQVYYIGASSRNIIILVGLFTGMVLGLQLYYVLVKLGGEGMIGTAVALALIRELGPVLTAIMITARAGSAMTAEIGIQRISEQIDALDTMRINSLRYLISPRLAAAIISFPLLTAIFDLIGIIGGYVSAVVLLGVDSGAYLGRIQTSVGMKDISNGFVKALVFALIVSTICCYQGYFTHRRSQRGAKGVGVSTTSAVVISCVLILISDYVVTSFLM